MLCEKGGLMFLRKVSTHIGLRNSSYIYFLDTCIKPTTTQYRILTHHRYIAVQNIVRKREIACNNQFFLFSQCFPPYMALIFHFKFTLKCCLQFV